MQEIPQINILDILNKLLNFQGYTIKNVESDKEQIKYNLLMKHFQEKFPLIKDEILQLLDTVKTIQIIQGHQSEPHIHKEAITDSIVIPIGDIHGDFEMFKYILFQLIKEKYLDENLQIIDERIKIVFMGDYIDNGYHQLAVLCLVLLLKIINPNNVYLIKGNHENPVTYNTYGFLKELQKHFPEEWIDIKKYIDQLFDTLPSLLYLQMPNGKRLHFSHGSAPLEDVWDNINIWLNDPLSNNFMHIYTQQCEWGEWSGLKYDCSCREIYTKFGLESISKYRELLNIASIHCGHQDLEYGCKQIVKNIKEPICVAPCIHDKQMQCLMVQHNLTPITLEELQIGHDLTTNMYGDSQCPITITVISTAPKICYDACVSIINTAASRVNYLIFRLPFFTDILHIEKKHTEILDIDKLKSMICMDSIDVVILNNVIIKKLLTRVIYNTPYTINHDGSIQFHCVEEIKKLLLNDGEIQVYELLLQYYGKI